MFKRNCKILLCFTLFVTLMPISQVQALISQIPPPISSKLADTTKKGSFNFIIGISFAFQMFSAIEENRSSAAHGYSEGVLESLHASIKQFNQALSYSGELKKADVWVRSNVATVEARIGTKKELKIWKEIMAAVKKDGAQGLLKMTIKSAETLVADIEDINKKLKLGQLPPFGDQAILLFNLTREVMRGVLISEVFFKP